MTPAVLSRQETYSRLYARLSEQARIKVRLTVREIAALKSDLKLCWRCLSAEERQPFFAPEALVEGQFPNTSIYVL